MNQFLGRIAAAFLLAALVVHGPAPSAQENAWIQSDQTGKVEKAALEQTYMVAVRALNFRQDPSVGNTPLSALARGAYARKLSETFNSDERRTWFQVAIAGGQVGWVASEYLTPMREPLYMIEGAAKFIDTLDTPATPVARVDPIRAGFLYVGPVGDAGWTYAHEQGRKVLEGLPYVDKATYVESVPGDPALVQEAIEKLIGEGHNVIFTTSYDHMDPTIEAARRHPEVVFMNCSGYKTERNAGTYFGRMYEARYLSGLIAGAMTQSGVLGYVAAMPTPDVVHGINAYALGAQSMNPNAKVRVLWTNSWYDPPVERQQAERLLDQGADVLAMEQDSPAVIQAAAQRGKYAIGYQSDMSLFAPEITLTSATYNWAPIYRYLAEKLHNGSWQPEQIWWGLDQGAVDLAPYGKAVPQTVIDLVAERRAEIVDGRLRIFEGPIRDAAGEIRVPARQVMSDADLLTMDFFVAGVEGDLPALPSAPEDAQIN
jgi:basic membrane protein A